MTYNVAYYTVHIDHIRNITDIILNNLQRHSNKIYFTTFRKQCDFGKCYFISVTMERVQNHVSDVSHVTPLSKN